MNTALICVMNLLTFCPVIKNCSVICLTVRTSIIIIVLRCVTGSLSSERFCLCCHNQIFFLSHKGQRRFFQMQLIVICKNSDCIAIRQCIQMQLVPCQVACSIYFYISWNRIKLVYATGICRCSLCGISLLPCCTVPIELIQCQMQVAVTTFCFVQNSVIIDILPNDSLQHCSLNGL